MNLSSQTVAGSLGDPWVSLGEPWVYIHRLLWRKLIAGTTMTAFRHFRNRWPRKLLVLRELPKMENIIIVIFLVLVVMTKPAQSSRIRIKVKAVRRRSCVEISSTQWRRGKVRAPEAQNEKVEGLYSHYRWSLWTGRVEIASIFRVPTFTWRLMEQDIR